MRAVIAALLLTVATFLAGCDQQTSARAVTPKEPGPGAIGFFCRMNLNEHGGPKGQILPKDWTEPLWFSSVKDALTYVDQDIVSEEELAAFWVNDMEQGTWERPAAGSWIEAKTAWYVIGSRKSSGMGGNEAVPFARRDAAGTFATQFGGRVVDYVEARQAMNEAPSAAEAEGGGT